MRAIFGFIQTTRFVKSAAAGLFLGFVSGSIYYGVGALLFLLFSFVFNDWVDAPKDHVGHPNRAVPSGKLTQRQALYISVVLLIIGAVWVSFFLQKYLFGFLIIYSFSIIYSLVLKPNIPILATPVWSVTIAILFLQSLSANFVAYIAITAIVYAYELFLDYRDRESDILFCKTPTLANILGKTTFVISGFFLLIGTALLVQILM